MPISARVAEPVPDPLETQEAFAASEGNKEGEDNDGADDRAGFRVDVVARSDPASSPCLSAGERRARGLKRRQLGHCACATSTRAGSCAPYTKGVVLEDLRSVCLGYEVRASSDHALGCEPVADVLC